MNVAVLQLEPWQWALLGTGAFIIGLSKSGIPGLGILFVGIGANALPPLAASGFILPLLLVGDVFAVVVYWRHTRWRLLGRLFPWTAAGVVTGYLVMGRIDDRQASLLVGMIVLGMTGLHFWRKWTGAEPGAGLIAGRPRHMLAAFIGMTAGFTTQVSNAGGPVMIMYFLAMGLPKYAFLGTGAVFFLLINSFKVPFMVDLGLINTGSLLANLWLVPVVIAGSLAGQWAAGRINQRWFENLALGLTIVAGIRLLI